MFVCSIGLYIVYRFSILWLPFALYLGWIYTLDFKTPFKGGTDRYWWFRTATFWKYMSSYFPIKLVNDSNGEITRDRNYVFVQNPHGFYCYGAVFNLVTNAGGFREKFPNIMSRISTLGFNFYVPIWREVQLAYGQISVDYNSCKYFLSKSMNSLALSLIIVVGGAEEAKYIEPNTMDLVLQKRKGFVKLALETGSSLVPVLTFGENDIYAQVPNPPGSRLRKFQDTLQRRFGFTLPLAYGRFLWLVPFKKPLVTVVGRPIHLEKIEKPDREVVEKWHALYIESVKDLYDKWKDVYAKDRKRDLRIVA
ncbi:diacylglycerol-acyltransferase [Paraphysoderma sedebokerense]|nr:diacylglycerol-acyltransferase [Paraphysoderma sedebokerense]